MTRGRLSDDDYRRFFAESNLVILIVDPQDGTIIEANRAARKFYEADSPDMLIGRKWSELNYTMPGELIYPDGLFSREDRGIQCRFRSQTGEIKEAEGYSATITIDGRQLTELIIHRAPKPISDLSRAMSKLELFQIMIDIIPSPIYCKNRKGEYILCNTAFEKFFDKPRTEIIGRTSQEVFSNEYSRKYHPQDVALMEDLEPRLDDIEAPSSTDDLHFLQSRRMVEYKARFKDNTGRDRTVFVKKTVFFDTLRRVGLIGIITDISELSSVNEELRLVHAAMEGASEGIASITVDGQITYANRVFYAISGYTPEELRDRDALRALFGAILDEADFTVIARDAAWQQIVREGSIGAVPERRIPVSLKLTPVIENGNHYSGVMAIITNLTDQIKERERNRIIEMQLHQALKLEAIGQLAAGIAHELNTPIQFIGDNINFLSDTFKELMEAVRSGAAMIEADPLPEEKLAEFRDAIARADLGYLSEEIPLAFEQSQDGVKRISDIVRAMKDFSHPSSGELKMIDINKAVTNTTTIARNEWKYVSEVKLDLAPDLPLTPCYEGEFKQVILNLLINAAHATGDALKQTGETAKREIRISTSFDADRVYIDVTDHGTGIPEAIRTRVFDPFFTTKETGRGTGQGLAISYDVIVNKHQGEIDFDTKLGQGTTFHVRLPRHPAGKTSEPQPQEARK